MSNKVLKRVYYLTNGDIPLIGVGGVCSAEDAYNKMKCGASLVQMYTGLIYGGPFLVRRMLREICQHAELDGYKNLREVVGATVRKETGMKPKIIDPDMEEFKKELPQVVPKSIVAKFFGIINY